MANDLPRLTAAPSIYEFLAAHVDELGRLAEDVLLPDEDPRPTGGVRWAPGALDGVMGHHGGAEIDTRAAELAALVAEAAAEPAPEALGRLLDACSGDALGVVDAMIDRLVALEPTAYGVHRVARWLAETATERAPVKIGIALLGISGVADAAGILRTLGAHDEFTLFAAAAFANGSGDAAESEIWALASELDGWGRIHCVERLSRTTDPTIRRWILRTGFRNSVMNGYLAYIAATTGGLLEALRSDTVDRELLDAASDIIEALAPGGPARDLDDWDDGADAIDAYLSVLDTRAETVRDYLGVMAVRDFLADDGDWEERAGRGWTVSRRSAFETACARILGRSQWTPIAAEALTSSDASMAWSASRVLRDLGVSTFEHHVAAIRADPRGDDWFDAWQQADDEGSRRLVELARDVLPLADIASGGALQEGHGMCSPDHMALDWTLQALRHHPGVGGDILLVGLRSPLTRNRNMALQALDLWPTDTWPDGVRALLSTVATLDPGEDTRNRAAELSQR